MTNALAKTEIVKTEADLDPQYEKQRMLSFFYPAGQHNTPGPAIAEQFFLDPEEDIVRVGPDGSYFLKVMKGRKDPVSIFIRPAYLWVEDMTVLVKKAAKPLEAPTVVH
jgi:hypothetical protein